MKLHPANRLLLWIASVFILSALPPEGLYPGVAVIVLLALVYARNALIRSLRRVRWLLLALLVIFAWSTPGVYVISNWYAPSVEGLYAGLNQTMRLVGAIAGLQLALSGLRQDALLSACYQLMRPLAWLGVNTTRFAVQLGLTLSMAEKWLNTKVSWRELMQLLHAPKAAEEMTAVVVLPFSRKDTVIAASIVICLVAGRFL